MQEELKGTVTELINEKFFGPASRNFEGGPFAMEDTLTVLA